MFLCRTWTKWSSSDFNQVRDWFLIGSSVNVINLQPSRDWDTNLWKNRNIVRFYANTSRGLISTWSDWTSFRYNCCHTFCRVRFRRFYFRINHRCWRWFTCWSPIEELMYFLWNLLVKIIIKEHPWKAILSHKKYCQQLIATQNVYQCHSRSFCTVVIIIIRFLTVSYIVFCIRHFSLIQSHLLNFVTVFLSLDLKVSNDQLITSTPTVSPQIKSCRTILMEKLSL